MPVVRTVLSFLLILFIVAGTAGLRVFKHACEEDGVFTSYFIQLDDHCGEHIEQLPDCCQTEHEKQDDCCSDEVDIYQVDFDYFQDISIEVPVFFEDQLQPQPLWLSAIPSEPISNSSVVRPPPRPCSGKEILIKHQVFRI
jgi:hypothetical protein